MTAFVIALLAILAAGSCFLIYEKRSARRAAEKAGRRSDECAACVRARHTRRYAEFLRDMGANPRIVATAERRARSYESQAEEAHRS